MPSGELQNINHIVLLMLENRSFDHMLGFLYADRGNVSPSGQPFEGLTGHESNPDTSAKAVSVYRIKPGDKNAYFMPGADPGEGYKATNLQLFGAITPPSPPVASNQGFVQNFALTIASKSKQKGAVLPGTVARNIMGIFPPEMLPVLSGLARGYAVCDHWFSSAPTETLPNRAFVCAATSQGHMDDKTKSFTVPSIFGLMSRNKLGWAIYGYDTDPLARHTYADITNADDTHFGTFADFRTAAASGTLPPYTFIEPLWGSLGNSQHPNYNVALGEQFIHDVYYALRNGQAWNETLLIVTYDEHGGCYDHVPPPYSATPPDSLAGEFGFDFKRFGVRVPAILVSPRIAAGTVFRVPSNSTPLDHTSVLKTVQKRWQLPALTARDAAAPDLGAALTLSSPRTDDPLKGVTVPVAAALPPVPDRPSHLQQVYADLVARLPVPDSMGVSNEPPPLGTGSEYTNWIRERTNAWKASRKFGRSGAA